jgi:hypothetical protein
MNPMKFLTDLFAAGFRLAASLNKTADLTDRFNADFEAKLDMRDFPLLIETNGTAEPQRRNGRVTSKL